MKAHIKRHIHWVVAAAAFFVTAVVLGLANNLYSLFMIPVTTELGVSRSAFSLPRSVNGAVYMMSNACFAVLYKRFGFRRPATLVAILTAVGYFGYARAQTLAPFYIGAALFGVGEAFLNTAGISELIGNWFQSHRGKVLGIVMSASGLGGAALSVLLSSIIETSSWRLACDLSGALLLVSAALVFLLLRDHPRQYGLEPYRTPGAALPDAERAVEVEEWDGEPMTRLVRRPFFYLIMAAMTLCSICMYGAFSTFVVHVQDQGLSASVAAACNSLLLLGLAVAKILVGAFCDRAAAHKAATVCLILGSASIFLLAGVSAAWQAVVAAVLLAFGLCMVGIVQPMLTMEMFGKKAYTGALGAMLAVTSAGNIAVAPLVNFAYDCNGSYSQVLFVLGMVSAITIGLFLTAFHIVRLVRAQRAAVGAKERA